MNRSSFPSLRPYNTFGVDATCDRLLDFHSHAELREGLDSYGNGDVLILGGGSNVLFVEHLPFTVMRNCIGGIEILEEKNGLVKIEIGAGVIWNDLVEWAVSRDLGGIENLSLIPGRVGAAPIQNIGAYGVELESCFVSLEAVELTNGSLKSFDRGDCHFGYRQSVFKGDLRNRFAITKVTLELSRETEVNTNYGVLRDYLDRGKYSNPTIRDVRQAVNAIRRSKLPDPAVLGNAGSFFKNPVVTHEVLEEVQRIHPEVPWFAAPDEKVKIPAGWLIERTGWRGKSVGPVGSHADQALVIVNRGGASGAQILEFSEMVRNSVRDQFGVDLEREVNVVDENFFSGQKLKDQET